MSVLFLNDADVIFCPTVKSQPADTFVGKSVAKVTPSHQNQIQHSTALFTLSRKLSFVTKEKQLPLSRPQEWETCCN